MKLTLEQVEALEEHLRPLLGKHFSSIFMTGSGEEGYTLKFGLLAKPVGTFSYHEEPTENIPLGKLLQRFNAEKFLPENVSPNLVVNYFNEGGIVPTGRMSNSQVYYRGTNGFFSNVIRPGISISGYGKLTGTTSLLLTDGHSKYFLTCDHINGLPGHSFVGDKFYHPGVLDLVEGSCRKVHFATLERWVHRELSLSEPLLPYPMVKLADANTSIRIDLTGKVANHVDAALIRIRPEFEKKISSEVVDLGYPDDNFALPSEVRGVSKAGRTTGATKGHVVEPYGSLHMEFPISVLTEEGDVETINFNCNFKRQVQTTGMILAGDSGALAMDQITKQPVGMFFASSLCYKYSYFTPIQTILDQLSTVKEAPGRNGQQTFTPLAAPLKMLQKRTFSSTAATLFAKKTSAVEHTLTHEMEQTSRPPPSFPKMFEHRTLPTATLFARRLLNVPVTRQVASMCRCVFR